MTTPGLSDLPAQPAADNGPYLVFVLLHARPELADALEVRLLRQVEPTRAEPGCREYHLGRDRRDPTRFYFYEAYDDLAAFQTHLDQDYNRALLTELPPYLAQDPDVRFGAMAGAMEPTPH